MRNKLKNLIKNDLTSASPMRVFSYSDVPDLSPEK